jgi:hypothetical protein
MKAFKITFSCTVLLLLFVSLSPGSAQAADPIPAFKTTNHYKALDSFTQLMKTRVQKKAVTSNAVKARFIKKLSKLTKNAKAKVENIFNQRSAQAWKRNRSQFSANASKIAADYEAIKKTILIEFRQTKLDMDQAFAAELRGIKEDWSEYIRPQVQRSARLKKSVRKAKKAIIKLKKSRGSKKVRKAVRKNKRIIRSAPGQIKLANKRARYWLSQRAIYLKEARQQYNIEVIAEQNQLKLDLADNQKELEDEIVSLNDNWRSIFDDQRSKFVDWRANDNQLINNLQASARSSISAMPSPKPKKD